METKPPDPRLHEDDNVVPLEVMTEKRQERVAETAQEYLAALSHVSIDNMLRFSSSSQKFGVMVDFLQAHADLQATTPNRLTPLFAAAYDQAQSQQTELLVVIEQLHVLASHTDDDRFDRYAAELVFHVMRETPPPDDSPSPTAA